MFTIWSRKTIYPALLIMATTIAVQLLAKVIQLIPKQPPSLSFDIGFETSGSLEDAFIRQHHAEYGLPSISPYIIDLFSTCKHPPNPHTNHVRLHNVHILNISMIPSENEDNNEFAGKAYFNPAIIPLPAYITTTTTHRYILVSRLVTTGSHQESHICFADTCSGESLPVNGARPCASSDTALLGSFGGMRCVSRPKRVNIPPTPSKKCTGAWSTFPDIPGFHDPRLLWSGRGEPLIEVNSGSQYGCVGLWIIDLRAIFPQLGDILKRNKEKRNIYQDTPITKQENNDLYGNGVDLVALGARTSYPHLMEITRNPRTTRSEVEKNWVLFFPSEEEAWIQYDMMEKLTTTQNTHTPSSDISRASEFRRPGTTSNNVSITAPQSTFMEGTFQNQKAKPIDLSQSVPSVETAALRSTRTSEDPLLSNLGVTSTSDSAALEVSDNSDAEDARFEYGPARRAESFARDTNEDERQAALESTQSTSTNADTTKVLKIESTDSSMPAQPITSPKSSDITSPDLSPAYNQSEADAYNAKINHMDTAITTSPNAPEFLKLVVSSSVKKEGGRTLAQITSHAHTTPNLTSPQELPCFDVLSSNFTVDAFGNHGHWHQSTPSLRLILCSRTRFAARTCPLSDSQHVDLKGLRHDEYDQLLRREGLIVHFSIVHRKFSNAWDLPMRYERYFLVWEARQPFQTIGISQWPILFSGERAQPWDLEKDLKWDLQDKKDRQEFKKAGQDLENKDINDNRADDQSRDNYVVENEYERKQEHYANSAYFTYTPSLSWAWRSNAGGENTAYARGHEGLGTGYLDEEIIIGIGMDDTTQGFVRVRVEEVIGCLRLCPGITAEEDLVHA